MTPSIVRLSAERKGLSINNVTPFEVGKGKNLRKKTDPYRKVVK